MMDVARHHHRGVAVFRHLFSSKELRVDHLLFDKDSPY